MLKFCTKRQVRKDQRFNRYRLATSDSRHLSYSGLRMCRCRDRLFSYVKYTPVICGRGGNAENTPNCQIAVITFLDNHENTPMKIILAGV
jgi:hypothetical protein